MYFVLGPGLKTKSITNSDALTNLSLVYNVEELFVEIKLAAFRFLSLFKVPITAFVILNFAKRINSSVKLAFIMIFLKGSI